MFVQGHDVKIDLVSTDFTHALNGGSIYVLGVNATISNSNFTRGNATLANGGSIFVEGDDANISGSRFMGSYAAHGGGAIFVDGLNTNIDKSSFDGNDATVHGGSIYVEGLHAVISGSNFTNSHAYQSGGAVYIEGQNATVKGSTFNESYAKAKSGYTSVNLGGALYIKGDYANIVGSQFNSSYSYCGGTIYLEGSYCNVTNSSSSNSYSATDGGAVYSTGSYSNLYYSNFTNAVAEYNGGSIYWFGGASSTNNVIVGCIFANNTIHGKGSQNTKGGGAIYWSEGGSYGVIRDSQFINNSAITAAKADGGAILWDMNTNCLIDNCTFDANYVTTTSTTLWSQGGAIYFRSNNVTVSNSLFKNCWSNKEGGAIYLCNDKDIQLERDFIIVNTTFINNTAKGEQRKDDYDYGGGAILIKQYGNLYFMNNTFINNTANRGGAISILKPKDNRLHDFNNCTFIGNKAEEGTDPTISGIGGAIWADTPIYINNFIISDGKADNYGGGIYTTKDIIQTNLTFINNTAKLGGGLYWNKNSVTIKDMVFINNNATQYGGAIYIPQSATVKNNDFTGNSAIRGGAIYVAVNNIVINSNNFTRNSAEEGGAIYLPASVSGGTITLSNFNQNHADYGGAIYAGAPGSSSKVVSINKCNFTENTAYFDGGAVYLANNYIEINSCNFNGNNASRNGGSVSAKESLSSLNIKSSTFNNSHADFNGGAVYGALSSGLIITNAKFTHNTADYNGGAVLYVTADGKYRDYHNFDGRGSISGGKTTVSDKSGTKFIVTCEFEDNNDYVFKVETTSEIETPTITVKLRKPNNRDLGSILYVVNITDGSEFFQQVNVTPQNYTQGHYDPYDNVVYVTFNALRINGTYNISVGFNDNDYMYKEISNITEQAHGEKIGEFTLLQRTIEKAIKEQANATFYEVNLTRSYTFTPFYFDEQLDDKCMNITNLDKPLVIRSKGLSVINAVGYSRIFNITASNVTFIGIQFIGGNARGEYWDKVDKGGAIFWAGENGAVINSTFTNNHAYIGGGLYLNESATNYKISGCTFNDNDADTYGGAIDCNAPKMNLTNTLFDHNTADTGAALCREVTATGGFGEYNNFTRNHALTNGSALAWINASSININHYIFIDNTAGYSGGAIYVGQGSGNCVVNNSYFRGNNITDKETGHGGAIEWYAANGTVLGSEFVNNNAHDGGAIYVGFGSDNINITKSIFRDNTAVTKGGAVSIEASKVIVNESEFHDNVATDGGALYVGGANNINYVYSSIFTGNIAKNGIGGAIDWVASSGTIEDSSLTGNCANYGGGIYFGGNASESTINYCNFTDNHAKYKGGAIDCNSSAMYLTNTIFDSNYAQFGSALCREVNAKGGHGENNTFKNNHAYLSGAALGWMGSVNITIINYTFINNSADVSGGAIYVGPDSHNCSVIDCYFENNYVTNKTAESTEFTWISWDNVTMTFKVEISNDTALIHTIKMYDESSIYYRNYTEDPYEYLGLGGAINVLADNATVTGTDFIGNYARLGGGIYVGANFGETTIEDSIFRLNVASERGGAVNLHASGVHIHGAEFYDNAAIDGGALYVGGVGTKNRVHDSVFKGNNATGYGAGIYWVAYEGEISDTNFTDNSAEYGGGVYLNGRSANTNLTRVIFKGNKAVKNGGAIECNASNIGIYYLLFEDNYAGEYGAVLCREINATSGHGHHNVFNNNHAGISGAALAWMGVKNININYYNFTNNTAGFSGAAIFIDKGSDNCIINNSRFVGNHIVNETGGHGGAIDIVGDNATLINSVFTENSAMFGGAVWAGSSSGKTTIYNVTFDKNHADVDGGAINLRASGVSMNYTYYTANTAGKSGGALYVGGYGTDNVIHHSNFINNTAEDHGGAIDWRAAAGEIKHVNFIGNTAEYGGGIYLNASDSRIFSVYFGNNRATKNGGAIDCNGTRMGLNNTKFVDNYAGEYGAALCREAGAVGGFGGNNTFIGNHAEIAGQVELSM